MSGKVPLSSPGFLRTSPGVNTVYPQGSPRLPPSSRGFPRSSRNRREPSPLAAILTPDPHAPASSAEIACAIPPGSKRARNQKQALRAGLSCPDLEGVRGDFRASLEAFWRLLVYRASWGDQDQHPQGVTSPSRQWVCERALTGRPDPATGKPRPMSDTVFKRCRRWFEERGYLAVVRSGWKDLRRKPDGEPEKNERPVYVLCVPGKRRSRPAHEQALDLNGPLSLSSLREDSLRARQPVKTPKPGPAKPCPALPGPLKGLTTGWWEYLSRPFLAAGWTVRDLLRAIDYEPDGAQHRYSTASVKHPAGWARWRLSRWLGADGTPLPAPSALARARRDAAHAELARQRAERARLEAGRSADSTGRAAEARALLARSSATARRVMERARSAGAAA